jgi:hypothetical protein
MWFRLVLVAGHQRIGRISLSESRERGPSPHGNTPRIGGRKHCSTPVEGALRTNSPQCTNEVIWKIGRYSAMIMPPTTTPRKAMRSGSISDVSASVVDSTSES